MERLTVCRVDDGLEDGQLHTSHILAPRLDCDACLVRTLAHRMTALVTGITACMHEGVRWACLKSPAAYVASARANEASRNISPILVLVCMPFQHMRKHDGNIPDV